MLLLLIIIILIPIYICIRLLISNRYNSKKDYLNHKKLKSMIVNKIELAKKRAAKEYRELYNKRIYKGHYSIMQSRFGYKYVLLIGKYGSIEVKID